MCKWPNVLEITPFLLSKYSGAKKTNKKKERKRYKRNTNTRTFLHDTRFYEKKNTERKMTKLLFLTTDERFTWVCTHSSLSCHSVTQLTFLIHEHWIIQGGPEENYVHSYFKLHQHVCNMLVPHIREGHSEVLSSCRQSPPSKPRPLNFIMLLQSV